MDLLVLCLSELDKSGAIHDQYPPCETKLSVDTAPSSSGRMVWLLSRILPQMTRNILEDNRHLALVSRHGVEKTAGWAAAPAQIDQARQISGVSVPR